MTTPVEKRLMRGGCYALALWLNRKSGLPLYGLFDEDGELHHALVFDPESQMGFDARGSTPADRLVWYQGRMAAGRFLRPANRQEVEALCQRIDPVPARSLAGFVRHQPQLKILIDKSHSNSAPDLGC